MTQEWPAEHLLHHSSVLGYRPPGLRVQLAQPGQRPLARVLGGRGVGVQLDHGSAGARRPVPCLAVITLEDADVVKRRPPADGQEGGAPRLDGPVQP